MNRISSKVGVADRKIFTTERDRAQHELTSRERDSDQIFIFSPKHMSQK